MKIQTSKCKACQKEFKFYKSEQEGIYCSRKCYLENPETIERVRQLGIKTSFAGRKHKPETIEKMRLAQAGRKHHRWGGENICYTALHKWVERHKGKAKKCEHCGTTDESKSYDWANVSKLYKRDLNDYIRLCRSCHRKFDAKL